MSRIKTTIISVVVLFIILGLSGALYLRSSLPDYDGAVTLSGLQSEVEIIRDENAIPHIYARSEHDLYYALGYAHAQDRLWHLEMNRRIASGRLAEVLGVDALGTDKFIRTLGVAKAATAAWESISDEARAVLVAYSDGINAYLENRNGALPPEFIILGFEPEPWQPTDSLGWLKMMAWDLSLNWRRELNRLDLLSHLSPSQLDEFYPPYRGDAGIITPDLSALYDGLLNLAPQTAGIEDIERSKGSNNWVVDGSRTESGKPMLANDPHLGFGAPAIWYMAHLNLNGKNIVGVSLPAYPAIILGRNDQSAWGFTNTGPDSQDLFMEKIAENPRQYITPEGVADFTLRREVIRVKDSEDIILNVRETRHGPVISDVLENTHAMLGDKLVLSFRWTALDATDTTPNPAARLMEIHTFDDFTQVMSDWYVPQQNMIFATTAGEIGYFAPARVPLRSDANLSYGRVPARGWDADYDWQGYLPVEEMPKRHNPDSGYVQTANAKIVDQDYPHYLTSYWAYPYRQNRIATMIEAREKHSVESFMDMQMDVYSEMAAEFLPIMQRAIADSHVGIFAAMHGWDRRMVKDRPEPLIYYAWHRNLAKHVYGDELGDKFPRYWHLRAEFLYNVLSNKNGQSRWCDNAATSELETCDALIRTALDETLAELTLQYGEEWREWQWQEAHIARHAHAPFSNVKALRNWFDITVPVAGGPYTVQVNNIRTPNSSVPFEARHGASYRAIYDLADLDNSRYVYPTGQSGNPLSGFYDNFSQDWADGNYFTVSTKIQDIRANAIGTLTLSPHKASMASD